MKLEQYLTQQLLGKWFLNKSFYSTSYILSYQTFITILLYDPSIYVPNEKGRKFKFKVILTYPRTQAEHGEPKWNSIHSPGRGLTQEQVL